MKEKEIRNFFRKKHMTLEVSHWFNGGAHATVIKKSDGKEIAEISINGSPEGHIKIESFNVREDYRNKHVGTHLMYCMLNEVKRAGGTKLSVFPNSEPYDGEAATPLNNLYEIYEHMGFNLLNETADRDTPNHEMVLDFHA